jgi:pentatricopeptide repeat protein
LLDLWGKYDAAAALYREVLSRDENNGMALNNLAWLLAERSKNGKVAQPYIDRAIQLFGPRAELLDTRAAVALSRGRAKAAVADLRQAVADSPTPTRYFHLARAYLKAKQPQEALKAFRQAKATGLEPRLLHPVERVAYNQIAGRLDHQ